MSIAVGLMSGTSLDGVDAALVEIKGEGETLQVELIDFICLAYDEGLKDEIRDCIALEKSNVQKICSLNFKLGMKFADAVIEVCQKGKMPIGSVDFIGSHGQTIWHQPKQEANLVSSTLQIGEPSVVAFRTGIKVVSNFRVMDVAAGGQGAPLVPYSEWLLYRDQNKNRVFQNIGGIGNLTYLPKNGQPNEIQAFDTGPGNMIIDYACQKLFGLQFDEDGKIAASGKINQDMLKECMSHPFLLKNPPKTTGREEFGAPYVDGLLKKFSSIPKADFIRTVTMFTAQSIVEAYKGFILPKSDIDQIIIGGGGAYNKALIKMIQNELGTDIEVMTQEELGYSSEAKEAIAFAILAHVTLHHLPSNLPGVTGALKPVILGQITSAS